MGRRTVGDPVGGMTFDKAGIDAIGHHIGVAKQTLQKACIGRNALDAQFAKGSVSAAHRRFVLTRRRVCDDFGEEAVEIGTRLETRVGVMIDADPRPRRRLENREGSAGRPR